MQLSGGIPKGALPLGRTFGDFSCVRKVTRPPVREPARIVPAGTRRQKSALLVSFDPCQKELALPGENGRPPPIPAGALLWFCGARLRDGAVTLLSPSF